MLTPKEFFVLSGIFGVVFVITAILYKVKAKAANIVGFVIFCLMSLILTAIHLDLSRRANDFVRYFPLLLVLTGFVVYLLKIINRTQKTFLKHIGWEIGAAVLYLCTALGMMINVTKFKQTTEFKQATPIDLQQDTATPETTSEQEEDLDINKPAPKTYSEKEPVVSVEFSWITTKWEVLNEVLDDKNATIETLLSEKNLQDVFKKKYFADENIVYKIESWKYKVLNVYAYNAGLWHPIGTTDFIWDKYKEFHPEIENKTKPVTILLQANIVYRILEDDSKIVVHVSGDRKLEGKFDKNVTLKQIIDDYVLKKEPLAENQKLIIEGKTSSFDSDFREIDPKDWDETILEIVFKYNLSITMELKATVQN